MTNIQQILKKFDEKFTWDSEGLLEVNEVVSQNPKDDIKSFLQTELSALLEGLVKEIEGEKKEPDCSENKDNACTPTCGFNRGISLAVDKIKKLIK